MKTVPHLHDHYLVGHEVDGISRSIKIWTRRRVEYTNAEDVVVLFNDVKGYELKNDAFVNIIASIRETDVKSLLEKIGPSVAASYRESGAPGPWAADIGSAMVEFSQAGTLAFELSSSYGMSGWIICDSIEIRSP